MTAGSAAQGQDPREVDTVNNRLILLGFARKGFGAIEFQKTVVGPRADFVEFGTARGGAVNHTFEDGFLRSDLGLLLEIAKASDSKDTERIVIHEPRLSQLPRHRMDDYGCIILVTGGQDFAEER